MALRRLVYAMHVCERESTPGHTHGPPVQLRATAPRHAPAPKRCAETARDGATAALRNDQNNSNCGAMACWALGPFGHGGKNPASIAA